jgi:APA family basic amino acid/polyamine antiporter
MLVVGSVVGAGIFLVGGFVAESVRSPFGFLGVWLLGGAFALSGALCNAELGALFPRGGGEYVYLRESFGAGLGFLSGWTSFWIGFPGSIATLAAGFGRGVAQLLGLAPGVENVIGLVTVLLLTGVNVFGLRSGRWTWNVLSVAKLAAFGAALVLGLAFGAGHGAHFRPFAAAESPKGLAIALVPIYFAYSGWNAATYVAGEMRDPRRDLARALALGTLVCTVLYLLVNTGFLNALGLDAMRNSKNLAGSAATATFGTGVGSLVTVLVVLAVLSSLQATIVVGPRIYHAMAEDGLFPARLARLSPKTRVPTDALVVQAVISSALLLSGRFETLLNVRALSFLDHLRPRGSGLALYETGRAAPVQDSGLSAHPADLRRRQRVGAPQSAHERREGGARRRGDRAHGGSRLPVLSEEPKEAPFFAHARLS